MGNVLEFRKASSLEAAHEGAEPASLGRRIRAGSGRRRADGQLAEGKTIDKRVVKLKRLSDDIATIMNQAIMDGTKPEEIAMVLVMMGLNAAELEHEDGRDPNVQERRKRLKAHIANEALQRL